MRKIIGINLLFLIPGKVGGTETFSRGLINEMLNDTEDVRYILFCNRENYHTFDKKYHRVLIPIFAKNRILRILVEQIMLPFYAFFLKIDILYSIGYTSPIFLPCKSVVNIFDLNWYYHPEDFSLIERLTWKLMVTCSANSADAITTSSYASKESIKKILKSNAKIKVIYSGLPSYPKINTVKKVEPYRNEDYFFSPSSMYPHKNLITLLMAFKKVASVNTGIKLYISGLGGRSNKEISNYIINNGLKDSVRLLGYVSDKDIPSLYSNSMGLVFTSAYEGYGMPIVEAFSLGVPVISSNAFSLKEVVGNGGVLVDPYNYDGFADEMAKVINDKRYREKLATLSKSESKRFSWTKSVNELFEFMKDL